VWLQLEHRTRELALFDLGLDSKLRSRDLVKLRVRDICHGDRVAARVTAMQQKTSRPVQFEITEQTRTAVDGWVRHVGLDPCAYGTHSMRRTKATLIYKRTKNLRAVQLLLGHAKLDYLPHRTMSRFKPNRQWPGKQLAGHSFPL
jgi:site-specific recombinase XerC